MLPINKFVLIATAVLFMYLVGLYRFFSHFEENKCGMTYMYGYPEFIDVPVARPSWGRNVDSYRLYLYAEGRFAEKVRHLRLTGIPVLFIPGNGGSYKQVRSLASISLHKGIDMKAPFHFNFFSLDLNEEYSALFGGVLNDQTKFAQESIRTILSLYPSHRRPVSIILVGHSMGGIIAKGLMLDEHFDASAVKVIVTLASPHIPIILFDEYLAAYYKKIDLHWQKNTENVTLVSVGGGDRDLHVRGALTQESSADIDVLAPSIPGVWKSTDHLCILWCKSLVKVINRAFFDMIDVNTMHVHHSDAVRADVFKYHFQHRSDGKRFYHELHSSSVKFEVPAKWIEVTEARFHYFEKGGIPKITYLMIPTVNLSLHSQFDSVVVDVENVKAIDWVFVCKANESRNPKYCLFGDNLSARGYIIPTLTQKRKQIIISAADINTEYFSHIIVKMSQTTDPVSVSVDFYKSTVRTIIAQLPSLLSFGETLIPATESGAVAYKVQISNLENEIQAGHLFVRSIKCEKPKHYAVLQTKIPWSRESTHTFSSYKKASPLSLKLYRPKPPGETAMAAVYLTLDPDCTYSVSIDASFIDSLAAVVQIYLPLLIPNIVGILLLTLAAQLMNLAEQGTCTMYHNVLIAGAQPIQTLCITNIATHILSLLGVVPVAHFQSNLWLSFFHFTVSFAVLYFVGLGLWYSLVFSTNKVSDVVLSFLTRFLGSLTWSEWFLSGLEQLPIIVSAVLVALVNSTCGGLSLSLGAIFYYLKLCSLYEDFLNYYIYYPFRYIKNQLRQRLNWKLNTELNDIWRKNLPPSVDDDANDLTPLHFHFTLFLLWTAATILNVPSTLMWAHNFNYSVHLQPDPSWLPGLALSLSAALIWPGSCPDPEIKYYQHISYLTYALACVCMVFCQHTIYYLQYIILSVFVLIGGHQFAGKYFARRSIMPDVNQLALTKDGETEHQALITNDKKDNEVNPDRILVLRQDTELKLEDKLSEEGTPEKLEESDSAITLNDLPDLVTLGEKHATDETNSSGSSTTSDFVIVENTSDSKLSIDSGVDYEEFLSQTAESNLEAETINDNDGEVASSVSDAEESDCEKNNSNNEEEMEEFPSSDESEASSITPKISPNTK